MDPGGLRQTPAMGAIVTCSKHLVWIGLAASGLVAAMIAVPVAAAPVVAPVAPPPAAMSGDDAHLKPFSAGDVQIDPDALTGGDAVVSVDPVDGLSDASVVITGSGAATVDAAGGPVPVTAGVASTAAVPVTVRESSTTADPAGAALADASGSFVRATLTGTDSNGTPRSASDTVWVDEITGQTIVSETGEQDVRLQRVDALARAGALSAAEAHDLDARILGGTSSTEAVSEGVCADVCVNGTVLWTDSAGGTHPVDRAPVQIRDEEPGTDQVVTTVTTDADGFFAATVDNDDGDATGRDLYVRVLADGPGFTLAQHINSGVTNNAITGSVVTKNLTANNTQDNNTAFSVHAALVVANDEIVAQNGSAFPAVPVVFPSDGSYYDGSALNLLSLDRFDWDVDLHEFGHYVADRLNIEANPGGFHTDTNLSDLYGSKSIGIRLAWGEGWPTYFAVSTLHDRAAGLGIPNVGDTSYQDTEDQVLTDDLEVTHTVGEDNEITDMAILWDLYDVPDDGRDTVSLGAATIWDTLDNGDPTTLSAAYALLSPGLATESTNCIFTQMNVAPKLKGAASQALPATPPTLTWKRGNGGSHANNRFSVKFRGAGGNLIFSTVAANTTSFTPGPNRWASIVSQAGGLVRVTVVGRQTDAPATGPYRSCTRSFGAA